MPMDSRADRRRTLALNNKRGGFSVCPLAYRCWDSKRRRDVLCAPLSWSDRRAAHASACCNRLTISSSCHEAPSSLRTQTTSMMTEP